jgi:hypothetical protein
MPPRLTRILAAATVVVLGTAACSQQSPDAATPPAATATPAVSGPAVSSPVLSSPVLSSPAVAATTKATPAAALKDGRWPGFVKKIDGDTAVTMDLVEFLTGDAAAKAWKKKYPDSDEDVPPNDYFIVNDNTKVRVLPLASSVVVKVVSPDSPVADKKIPPADLDEFLDNIMFWFTVKGGKVSQIEQQFLP